MFQIPNLLAILLTVGISILARTASYGAPRAAPSQFGPRWKTLIGEWKGENQTGAPAGACGFHFDLADPVMVRTNRAVLAVAAGPVHDDLMVMSPEPTEDKARASYFDNEGHVIEYVATWSPDGNTLTFLSKPVSGAQFRLTYKKINADNFSVSFEMAPPGQSAFRPYTAGKLIRQK